MPTLEVSNTGSREKQLIGSHKVTMLPNGQGSGQTVYSFIGDNSDTVVKILGLTGGAKSMILDSVTEKFASKNNIRKDQVHYKILKALMDKGVAFPNYWDTISGEIGGEQINGFVQTFYDNLPEAQGGELIGLDGEVLERPEGNNEFYNIDGKNVFLDWDEFLKNILQEASQKGLTLDDITERIGSFDSPHSSL